jgi:glycosyltransferase involved in cell wall biosynthesis
VFCSVIIPTIGRESLTKAVCSVLDQEFPGQEMEIVIVNDSGDAAAATSWHSVNHVRIITTNRRERCVARNTGAAAAKGTYLWFLDDDDWMLPGAMRTFEALASRSPEASWLYGGLGIVDVQERVLVERNSGLNGRCFAQVLGGAWAPIQSSIIKADAFFEVGGFNPQIIGTEDLDLTSRIARIGEFANTKTSVACLYRGDLWSTSTDYSRAPADIRRSRDEVLDKRGTYSLLRNTADSAYWHGRIVRVYMSTITWNLQQGRYLKAFGRGLSTALSTLQAGGALFSRQFWSGVQADHVPGSLHFVMKDLERLAESHPAYEAKTI